MAAARPGAGRPEAGRPADRPAGRPVGKNKIEKVENKKVFAIISFEHIATELSLGEIKMHADV